MPGIATFTGKDGQVLRTYIPGGYSSIKTLTEGGSFANTNNVVLVGEAKGGDPYVLTYLHDFAKAQILLKGGKLLDGISLALNPGGGLKPQQIGVMRANSALKASRLFYQGIDPVWKMEAASSGTLGNSIKAMFEVGTSVGHKISIQDGAGNALVFDDIQMPQFNIVYSGAGTTSTITVTWEKITLTVDAVSTDISFSDFADIGSLVTYLENLDDYSCTLLSSNPSALLIYNDAFGIFDYASSVDLMAPGPTGVNINSDIIQIMETVNLSQTLVTLEFDPSFTGNRMMADVDTNWMYLTGGSNGTLSASEWAAALTELEKEDVQILVPLSDDLGVRQMFKEHCEKMNSMTGKNERQAIGGGAYGESRLDAMNAAISLNSPNFMNVHVNCDAYNSLGQLVHLPSYMIAAMIAGVAAAVDFNEPLTWKILNIITLHSNYTRDEYEELLSKGVCPITIDNDFTGSKVIKVMRQLTTFQGDDIIKNEWSLWRGALMVTKDLRQFVENRNRSTGKKGTIRVFNMLKQDANKRMKDYVSNGWLTEDPNGIMKPFVINDFRLEKDRIYIDWTGILVGPINFEFIQNNFTVIGVTQ
jgi:hypothetical protein